MATGVARYFRRPFSNAHWTLLAALIIVWDLLLFSQPCKEGPRYAEVGIASATLVIALWVSHLRSIGHSGWRKIGNIVFGALYDLTKFLIFLIVFSLPIAIFMPAYQCYTPRAKVSELILYASTIRSSIEDNATKLNSLVNAGQGVEVKQEGRVKGGFVTQNGTIVIVGEDPPAVVMMAPTFAGGKISWNCIGYPTQHMPMSCRESKKFVRVHPAVD